MSTNNLGSLSRVSLLVIASSLTSNHTFAADDQAGSTGGLQEIVVTAERREETIDTVPMSIAALDQRTMDNLHIENVNDLATVVPGLALAPPTASPDFGEIGIRGIYGAIDTAPTTQLYIDETPIGIRELGNAYSKSPWPNIFDLDRVEVLRGPQGTLFGASAMGGAIRFITPQPSVTDTSGTTKAEFGYTDNGDPAYEVGAAYGAPLVAGAAGFRVSGWYQSLGGYIDRIDPNTGQTLQKNANYSDSYVVRPAVTLRPSDTLAITAAFFFDHNHEHNPDEYWVTELPVGADRDHVWAGFNQPMTDNLRVSSLSIKYDFAGLSLVSDTSYLDRTSAATEDTTAIYSYVFAGQSVIPALGSSNFYNLNTSYTHAWQQELRLSSQDSPSSPLSWIIGAFFRNAVQGLQQVENDISPLTEYAGLGSVLPADYIFDGQPLSGYSNYQATDRSEALFGDLAFKLLPGLKLDLGARVEHVTVRDQQQLTAGPLNGGTNTATLPDAIATPVTPRGSLSYQVAPDDMVYVSAAKGFRPGGGNPAFINTASSCQPSLHALGLSSAPTTFEPDHLWSYEIGTKDLFFDRHVSIEASIYHIEWSDIQTAVTVPSCQELFINNQGEVISNGFDLQLNAKPTEALLFGAVAAYTHTYYPNAAYGAPPTNSNGQPIGPPPLLNAAGGKLPNVNPWTAAANAQYTRDIGSLWSDARSYVRIDYRWLSAQTPYPGANPNLSGYDPDASPFPNPAYGMLNIRLGVMRGGLDLSVYVNNATNTDPQLGYTRLGLTAPPFSPPGSGLFYGSAIRPLTTGVTIWYRF